MPHHFFSSTDKCARNLLLSFYIYLHSSSIQIHETPFLSVICITITPKKDENPKTRFRMSCIRISASPNASAIGRASSMDLASRRRRGPANIRFKPSFNVIRAAQVSGAEYQSAPAIEAGGHMKNSGTLYEVLGLSRGATARDIKTVYRKMALRFHPDTAASSQGKTITTEMFLQIHNAYAVLSKAEDRAQYDRRLEMQQRRTWNRGPNREPRGHVVRNWETDQCW